VKNIRWTDVVLLVESAVAIVGMLLYLRRSNQDYRRALDRINRQHERDNQAFDEWRAQMLEAAGRRPQPAPPKRAN